MAGSIQGIIDIGELIKETIDAANKINKKQSHLGINRRELKLDTYGLPELRFADEEMNSILDAATQFDIIGEYLSIVTKNRANIIDPETGSSYFACNDMQINPRVKKVSFINDNIYEKVIQNFAKIKELGLNFNIRKFMKTPNNLYYDISFMINLISNPGITRIPDDFLKQNLQPTFKQLLDFILDQSISDIHRNKCRVFLGDKTFEFIKPADDKPVQDYFDRVVSPNLKEIYDICFETTNNIFTTSKILFSIIMALTQTFDFLDNKLYEDLGLGITQDKFFVKQLTIDLNRNAISWVKLFQPKVNLISEPPFLIYSQSSLLYKCYDYLNDAIYATIVLIIPKYDTNTLLANAELYVSDKPAVNNIILTQRDNFEPIKPNADSLPPINIGGLQIPLSKGSTDSIKYITVGEQNKEHLNLNFEFPGSWGSDDIIDYLLAHQLFGRKYLEIISKKIGKHKMVNAISDLLVTCNFNHEQIHGIMSDFFASSLDLQHGRDIKIIKSIISSSKTGDKYPIFFLLRKTILKSDNKFYNIIYHLSSDSLPKGDIFDMYSHIIKSFPKIPNVNQFLPIEYYFKPLGLSLKQSDDDIKFLSVLTLFSTINGILAICDNITKPKIQVTNLYVFLSQLPHILNKWHYFDRKHVLEVLEEEPKKHRPVLQPPPPPPVRKFRTLKKQPGASSVSYKSLEGGRKIFKPRCSTKKKVIKNSKPKYRAQSSIPNCRG